MQIEQTELLMAVFGAFDENIKQIERELNVSVISRGTELKITGEDEGVSIAARAITALLAMAGRGESIGTQTRAVRYRACQGRPRERSPHDEPRCAAPSQPRASR